jgi:molecular chaperone DnaK
VQELQGLYERLTNINHKISSDLYKTQGGSGSGGGDGGPAGDGGAPKGETKDGEDVVDADYKDVN